MIKIHQGYISELNGISTMITEIEIDNRKVELKLSVSNEYGKFFSPERADYALVGLLRFSLLKRHDIICEAPVTDELLYNIQEMLLPTLLRSDSSNYPVKIQAKIAPPLDKIHFSRSDVLIAGGGVLEQEFLAEWIVFILCLSILIHHIPAEN